MHWRPGQGGEWTLMCLPVWLGITIICCFNISPILRELKNFITAKKKKKKGFTLQPKICS